MRALKESEEMRKKGYDEGENVKVGADQYAESVLVSLEQNLSEALSIVRNGQKQLMSKVNENKYSHSMQTNGRDKEPAIIN